MVLIFKKNDFRLTTPEIAAAMFAATAMLAQIPGYFCPVSPKFQYNQYSDSSVRLYDFWGGAPAWEYVNGNDSSFRESRQYCSFRNNKMICSDQIPSKNSIDIKTIQNLKGNSCGCIGFTYCINGVGTNNP
jgi:hypothetical protein